MMENYDKLALIVERKREGEVNTYGFLSMS